MMRIHSTNQKSYAVKHPEYWCGRILLNWMELSRIVSRCGCVEPLGFTERDFVTDYLQTGRPAVDFLQRGSVFLRHHFV
jgi:hypothetical protein